MDIINLVDTYFSNKNIDNTFFNVYPFTTENIDGYMQYFKLRDSSLLTVGSSSDQAINAALAGCSDITVLDICPLTKYFYYLKLASILFLSREELLDFLCKTKYSNHKEYNPHLLTKKTFFKIKDTLKFLDYDSYCLWDYLFCTYKKDDIVRLFRRDVCEFNDIVHFNRYLKNDYNYNHIKLILKNLVIKFVSGDVVSTKLDRKFDNIWLSNISKYLKYDETVSMFNNALAMLNDDGKVLLSYFYTRFSIIESEKFGFNAFSEDDYLKKNVAGNDSIYIYQKRKSYDS